VDRPLPDDVLIELGSVTWAAIVLEDLVDAVCQTVHPTNPRNDRRPIGQKVKDARADLRSWTTGTHVDRIDDWLAAATAALERRNALFHAVPLVVFDGNDRKVGKAVGEMPRAGSKYVERHMTVGNLRIVASALETAQTAWRDIILLAARSHPQLFRP
jgi:hypothetical protein